MVETAEAYYDGTLDEEVEDIDDTDASDDSGEDADEDYFNLDGDDEESEESNDEETDDESDDEVNDGDDEESDEADKSEEKEEPKEKKGDKGSDSRLEEAVKDFLASFGLKDIKDLPEEIKKLTAESMGITVEEYERRVETRKAQAASWEAQMKRDIDDIHEAFPVTKKYKTLKELPNKELFAQLMDDKKKNLSAVAAFAASHPDIVKAHSNAPARNSDLKGTKDHIKSNVPKGAKDTSTYISKGDMETYREMFPGLSDKEIKRLFKSTNN